MICMSVQEEYHKQFICILLVNHRICLIHMYMYVKTISDVHTVLIDHYMFISRNHKLGVMT